MRSGSWVFAKEVKAVRLFGLTLVSGDTAELSIPDGERNLICDTEKGI